MKRITLVALAAALTVTGLAGCTRTVYVHDHATSQPSVDPAAVEPAPSETTSFDYNSVVPTISLKVLSKDCTDGYGCVERVEPVLKVADPSLVPADASGSITYEIDGSEGGPVIETVDLNGTQYRPDESVLTGVSPSKAATVHITDVTTN